MEMVSALGESTGDLWIALKKGEQCLASFFIPS